MTLSAASAQDVTVDYATSDVTALAGSDYTEASGTLTIDAGETTGTITVEVLDDGVVEGEDETFTVKLSARVERRSSTVRGWGPLRTTTRWSRRRGSRRWRLTM